MYVKVFGSMFDGTLATKGPWQAVVALQQLLILASPDGIVDMTQEAISRRTTIPIEIIAVGIAALEQPDAESRSPDQNGRRITRLSDNRAWGWQIVNYAKYRALRNEDDRREYMRQYMATRRAEKQSPEPVNSVNNVNIELAAVSNVSPSSKQYAVGSKTLLREPDGFARFWSAYPRRSAKAAASKAWAKIDPDTSLLAAILRAVEAQAKSEAWTKDAGKFVPYPASWLNGRRWEDELPYRYDPADPRDRNGNKIVAL